MDQTGVVVTEGAEHPLRHALSIGRDPGNDIVIAKTTVSRHHAVLNFIDSRWLIEDRGSANGTYVNGQRVPYGSAYPLRHGDRIGVGAASLMFSWPADGQEESVRLVLEEDGSGWIERDGQPIDLSEEQLDELRSSGSLLGDEGLESLSFERWIVDAKLSEGSDGTDKVTAELDVAAA